MIGAALLAIYLSGLFFFWLLVYVSNKPNDPGPPFWPWGFYYTFGWPVFLVRRAFGET